MTAVEVAEVDGVVVVRDAKAPYAAVLIFTRDEWSAFTAGVRAGAFDLPQGAQAVSAGDGSGGGGATRGAGAVLADFGAGPVPA